MPADFERHDRTIIEHLCGELDNVVAVYRFGSTADGTATRTSDVDIAVLVGTRLDPLRRFDVQEAVAAKLGADVDLIDLASASPVLAIQIITRGRLLHDADPAARGRFEDRTFGAYARLNEERRGILERIAAEGTVYGR